MSVTKQKAITQLRTHARELGMVFRVQKKRIDGVQAYELTNRATGELIKSDLTVFATFKDAQAGYFELLASKNGCESEADREQRVMAEQRDAIAAKMTSCINRVIRKEVDDSTYASLDDPRRFLCRDRVVRKAAVRINKTHNINIASRDYYHNIFIEVLDNALDLQAAH